MTKVLFLPEVVDQFLELAEILYHKGYLGFNFAENSKQFTIRIIPL